LRDFDPNSLPWGPPMDPTEELAPQSSRPNSAYALPCNLSLVACFPILMFHKVVWQRKQGVMGFLLDTLLQIYYQILCQWKNFENC